MNDPNQPAWATVNNATTLGLNPYVVAESKGFGGDVDARSEGLTGETLDALLRRRWEQGFDTGRREGSDAAMAHYATIYDEGFVRGADHARRKTIEDTVRALAEPVQLVLDELVEISKATSSTSIRQAVDRSLASLRGAIGAVGEMNRGVQS